MLASWKHSEQSVEAVALSPDGSTAVSADHTGAFKVWDVATGNAQPPVTLGCFFPGAAFTSKDQVPAWAGNGPAEYNVREQTVTRWRPNRASVYSRFFAQAVVQSRVHRYVSQDLTTIFLIDTATDRVVTSWKDFGNSRYAFSTDGKLLASISEKGSVEIRDAVSGALRQTLAPKAQPWTLAFSSDDALLAVGTGDNRVIMFDLRSGALL